MYPGMSGLVEMVSCELCGSIIRQANAVASAGAWVCRDSIQCNTDLVDQDRPIGIGRKNA